MNDDISPRLKARFAGVLYLVIIVVALFAQGIVRGGLIVPDDAAETAKNILASQQFYRLGGGADIVVLLCDVALAALFFDLLKPVSAGMARLAAYFRLAHATIFAFGVTAHFAAISVLTGDAFSSFSPPQLQALAMFAVKMQAITYNVALVFFGVHCVLLGRLVARSGFLPALIGWLLMVAGICYLINSATHLVFTHYDFFPWILMPGLVAEGGLTLWLLFFGLNQAKWEARAGGET